MKIIPANIRMHMLSILCGILLPFSCIANNAYSDILAILRADTRVSHGISDDDSARFDSAKEDVFKQHILSEQSMQEHALGILSTHDKTGSHKQSVLFEKDAWDALDLLTGPHNILRALDKTKTIFGRLYLAKLLTSPTNNVMVIRKRQNMIRSFMRNQEVRDEVRAVLGSIGSHQNHLIALTDPQHPLYDDGIQNVFHQWGPRRILTSISSHPGMDVTSKLIGDAWFVAGPFVWGVMLYKLYNSIYRMLKSPDKTLQSRAKGYLAGLTGVTLFTVPNLASMFNTVRSRYKTIEYIRKQLAPLTTLLTGIEQCQKIVGSNRILNHTVETGEENTTVLSRILNDKNIHSWFGARRPRVSGRIIAAVPHLYKQRIAIFKGIDYIAALDAYTALAELYQSQSRKLPFCFAQFKKQPKPYLHTSGFWHPILPHSTNSVVLNSITLGNGHEQNIVLTGLPESGKSTTSKAIALNVLCAQTIGICPAAKCELTPFTYIDVYANIKDDLANNRSLFKTELYRSLQLVERIKSLPARQHAFVVFDEMFKGTEATAGEAASWAVNRYVTQLPNCISVSATNFSSLGKLEKVSSNVKNYFLPVTSNGSMSRSYTLMPGRQPLAQTTAIFGEEKYPRDMIELMKDVINNPSKYEPKSQESSR